MEDQGDSDREMSDDDVADVVCVADRDGQAAKLVFSLVLPSFC